MGDPVKGVNPEGPAQQPFLVHPFQRLHGRQAHGVLLRRAEPRLITAHPAVGAAVHQQHGVYPDLLHQLPVGREQGPNHPSGEGHRWPEAAPEQASVPDAAQGNTSGPRASRPAPRTALPHQLGRGKVQAGKGRVSEDDPFAQGRLREIQRQPAEQLTPAPIPVRGQSGPVPTGQRQAAAERARGTQARPHCVSAPSCRARLRRTTAFARSIPSRS